MLFPKYFYQTGYESDRMFIQHRLNRISNAKLDWVVEDYERRYRSYGRHHANEWLTEVADKLGEEAPEGLTSLQSRLERLNQLSRDKRNGQRIKAVN